MFSHASSYVRGRRACALTGKWSSHGPTRDGFRLLGDDHQREHVILAEAFGHADTTKGLNSTIRRNVSPVSVISAKCKLYYKTTDTELVVY